MSGQYYHPTNVELDIWDPLNFDLDLGDQTSIDHVRMMSPYILYWKMDHASTLQQNDELSNLYQETDEGVYVDKLPTRVYAYIENSPIINELNRMGLSQLKEINFIANITDIKTQLGREPLPGDIFRISYISNDNKNDYVFYVVVSISDSDLYLYRYIHYIINAEQTNMSNVPKEIRDYLEKE